MLLTFVFCVSKQKGMTTKKPEEATYFMAGNSSRICEKIQIHFELNFVSLTDSVKHFELVFSPMLLGSNNYMQLKSNFKTDKSNGNLS